MCVFVQEQGNLVPKVSGLMNSSFIINCKEIRIFVSISSFDKLSSVTRD